MATLGDDLLTLSDIKQRLDGENNLDEVIELLSADNEGLFADMPWLQGNLPTGHKTTVRTGEPTISARLINQGVVRGKSATAQITDTCALFESRSAIDEELLALSGNAMKARMQEDAAFISAYDKRIATATFYSNEGITPAEFTGFGPRFNSLSAENADNIIDAGGTGSDNASIWLIGWGPMSCFGIYPRGSNAGMELIDLGKRATEDDNGNEFEAFHTQFKWKAGLCVRDWRYVVRICNIDVSNLQADPTAGGANLIDLMTQAVERIQARTDRTAFYIPRKLREVARRQALNLKNVRYGTMEIAGKTFQAFDDIPVRRLDALLLNESRVVA